VSSIFKIFSLAGKLETGAESKGPEIQVSNYLYSYYCLKSGFVSVSCTLILKNEPQLKLLR
jgi:hypothetical protein